MNTKLKLAPRTSHLALAVALLSTLHSPLFTQAQGTAFTYQGRLNDGAAPVNGSYDLRFTLYTADVGGSQRGPILTNAATAVNNGLFTVQLDFGAVFPGADRWIELGVRTNGSETFTTLSPRQPLTPTPYAIFAANVALTNGAVDSAQLASSAVTTLKLANDAVTSLKVADDSLLPADLNLDRFNTTFWKVGGNAGTSGDFIGTTDEQPFDIRVNNVRAMRYRLGTDADGLYDNAPNVIGGSSVNSASTTVVGATIGGGGSIDFISISHPNKVTANFGTVGGGRDNTSSGELATVGGGHANSASGSYSTVSGGDDNTASGYQSTVPGGSGNTASGFGSFAAGRFARASHENSFVWGDGNTTSSTSDRSVTMRASGGFRFFTASGAVGARLDPDQTSWSSISDRNVKKNFRPVDGRAVLDKLASMPVQSWNYQWEADTNTPHLGPMAQDFKAAFYPGRDDKSISTLEFDGVALAAIQGLNQKLSEQETRLKNKDSEIQELRQAVAALQKTVSQITHKTQE